MSEERLRDLMRTTAEPVDPPAFAESTWLAAGRRTRRHRRIGLTVTAAVVALVALVATVWRPSGTTDRHRRPAIQRTVSGRIPVTVVPDGRESRLPRASTILPATIDTDPAHAVPLSADPVNVALGLFAPYPEGWPAKTPKTVTVLVLGDDGRMRRIDTVPVRGTLDGLSPAPIVAGALDSTGTEAAFPQPDGTVLVVDLRGTGYHRYHVGGTVRSVFWAGVDRHLLGVERDDHTDLVTIPTGIHPVRHLPYTGAALPQRGMWGPVMMLTGQPAESNEYRAPQLDVWQDSTHMTRTKLSLPGGMSRWYGAAFTDGTRVARATFGDPAADGAEGTGESVVAVRRGRAEPLRILSLPYGSGRGKLCCQVLGWPEGNAVLVDDHDVPHHRILAWNVRTGKLWRVATLSHDAQVSLVDWIRLPDAVSR